MANATGAFGLRPVRHLNGSPWNGQTIPVYVSSSYATALFVGDPVVFSDTLAEKDTTGRYQTINKSTGLDGIIIAGVIVGFEPDPDNLNRIYNPASTERIAYITVDKTLLYAVRGDGLGTPSKVFVGQNAVMIASTAGDTTTGLSGMELDEGGTTAPSADQSNPLLIEGIYDAPDNTLADSAVYLVRLNTAENALGDIIGVTAT